MASETPQSVASVTALILAGGKSHRMGQDKALLTINGIPMLLRICAAAVASADAVAVITPRPQAYQAILPNEVGVIVETPMEAFHGPLLGLLKGADYGQGVWVLALACDLPHLTGGVLRQWRRQLAGVAADKVAYLPHRDGRWEPLCGFYRRHCLADMHSFAQAGGRSFQKWLANQSVQAIPAVNPQWILNVNTQADLSRLSDQS